MRPLAASEKRLFLILCGAVFIALNMVGAHAFLQARNSLQRAILGARTQLAEDQGWIGTGEALRPARNWMETHPMPELAPDEASARLLQSVRGAAEKTGLKITEENLLPPQQVTGGSTVAVAAKVSGRFDGVVRLLFELQNPEAWRSVEKLTLRSDAEPPNVIADLELRQYFRSGPAGGEPQPPTPR